MKDEQGGRLPRMSYYSDEAGGYVTPCQVIWSPAAYLKAAGLEVEPVAVHDAGRARLHVVLSWALEELEGLPDSTESEDNRSRAVARTHLETGLHWLSGPPRRYPSHDMCPDCGRALLVDSHTGRLVHPDE